MNKESPKQLDFFVAGSSQESSDSDLVAERERLIASYGAEAGAAPLSKKELVARQRARAKTYKAFGRSWRKVLRVTPEEHRTSRGEKAPRGGT